MDKLRKCPDQAERHGRRMLVTGANGLLGREIAELFSGEYTVRGVDIGECDVTRGADCRREIEEFLPDVVVHCAAYTAVDRAETDEAAAFAVNVEGTRNMARESREHGALMVTYGTDYIFDGMGNIPYREEVDAHPLSAYGRSKWAAEQALREEAPSHLLIRSQWLYGPHGKNFVFAILDKARSGETLRVVSDQTGCPTYSKDLAGATKRLLDVGARGTFHFSNEGETTWFGLASFFLSRAYPQPVVLAPALSRELSYPAPRPAYSVLSKEKYRRVTGESPRRWEDALTDFLKKTCKGGSWWRCEY